MEATGLRAVIYVVDGVDLVRQERICVGWCNQNEYEIVALVVDDPSGRRWRDALAMLVSEEAEILVVSSWEILPPDRIPRAEIARDEGGGIPRERRPRTVRWRRE